MRRGQMLANPQKARERERERERERGIVLLAYNKGWVSEITEIKKSLKTRKRVVGCFFIPKHKTTEGEKRK